MSTPTTTTNINKDKEDNPTKHPVPFVVSVPLLFFIYMYPSFFLRCLVRSFVVCENWNLFGSSTIGSNHLHVTTTASLLVRFLLGLEMFTDLLIKTK
jgi:hypothetical protein